MYVVPFSMGPIGSPVAQIGVQVTDSAYVAASMRIMTRMGAKALEALGEDGRLRPVRPLSRHAAHPWRARRPVAVQRDQVHRPLPRGPRDLVLRLGLRRQRPARQEVPGAAHRLGDGPRRGLDGRAHADHQADLAGGRGEAPGRRVPVGVAARPTWRCCRPAFPAGRSRPSATTSPGSASARTAASTRSTPRPASSASPRARASKTNPNAMKTVEQDTIFTNVAKTDDGDIWWEGMSDAPDHLIDWKGRDWTPDSDEPAAHPNSRFTVSVTHCPTFDPAWDDPAGVRSTPSCSAGAGRPSCRSCIRRSTGSTACSWRRRCRWRRRRRPPARSASSASTRSPCCRSAATTWPTT